MTNDEMVKGWLAWHKDEILAINKRLKAIQNGRIDLEQLGMLARLMELVADRIEETKVLMLQALDDKQKEK